MPSRYDRPTPQTKIAIPPAEWPEIFAAMYVDATSSFSAYARASIRLNVRRARDEHPREFTAALARFRLVGLVGTDRERRVVSCNTDFTAICGYTLDELRGKNLRTLLHGPATEPKTIAKMGKAIHARRSVTVLVTNYAKSGAVYRAQVRIKPTDTGFTAQVRLAP